MLSDVLSIVVLIVIGLTAWLLPKYLEARVTQAARGAVDERVGKLLRDYSLFATKRNEVYADTFSLLEKARGLFTPHFSGIRIAPDFSRSTGPDLTHFVESDPDVGPGERADLLGHVQRAELAEARTLAGTLHDRAALRRAHAAFRDFKNATVLNALYFSEDVDRLLAEAIAVLARMAAWAIDLEHVERHEWEELRRLLSELDGVTRRVRDTMRSEMQATFR